MMVAGELALADVDVLVVERRADQGFEGTRSRGLHSRTIEVLDQRGIAERFIEAGYTAQIGSFADARLDISDFPTRHNYGLALSQERFEEILGEWIDELGVPILRSREVTGFAQGDAGVDVALAGGESLHAEYLVGCDGGRSVIRRAAGIDFPGWDAATSYVIAEAEWSEEPDWGIQRDAEGIHAVGPLEDGGAGFVVRDSPEHTGTPTLADLSEALISARGTDYGVHSPSWISRFTDATRQAASYRAGRVLLAGDAAHIHAPIGGQGLQLGVQDAVNLGWKLAQVVKGTSPDALLDTYESERHPVAARVLQVTMAQTALSRSDARIDALRDVIAELMSIDEPRKRFAALMTGLDIRYDFGEGHPLLGRRMPDLDITTTAGSTRVYALLHEARPVLVNFGQPGALAAGSVRVVDARHEGAWELPAIGEVSAPSAVLVRPDGHVAWVGDGTNAGLSDALRRWFGN
jgi:3-(3-hydroxy-phenyl)propionate hydroxylase